MHSKLPQVKESVYVYNGFMTLRRDILLYPNGHESRYDILEAHADAVVVLAITKDHKFVLTEEYRHPTNQVLLSLSGGFLEEKEDPLLAAQRELLEETGYVAKQYILLGSAYPYPGASSQRLYYVAAINASFEKKPDTEPSEVIVSVLKTKEELKKAIQSKAPIDGNLLAAYGAYQLLDVDLG